MAVRPLDAFVVTLVALPALAGLAGTVALATGAVPVGNAPPFPAGVWRASLLSLWTGLAATLLAVLLTGAILASVGARAARLTAPLAAVPHAALGLGLAFLIAPSGFLVRLLGFDRPPDVALLHDPWGLGLILALVIKEVPFLLILSAGALARLPVPLDDALKTGRMLGRSDAVTWRLVVLPMLGRLIRMPVLIVLAYSVTVTDLALILGPANPPTLAVLTLRLANAPDLGALALAAQLALLQVALVGLAAAGLAALAQAARLWRARLLAKGGTGLERSFGPSFAGQSALVGLLSLGSLAMVLLFVWSFATRWSFPDLWPDGVSLKVWRTLTDLWPVVGQTLALGVASALLSLLIVILLMEFRDRPGASSGEVLVGGAALPLILPQMAFLFGLQIVLLRSGLDPGFGAVLFAEMSVVLPYTLLSLAGPWAAFDRRLIAQARSLGAGPVRILLAVKLPVLLTPILSVLAIAFSVSVAQYLTVLLAGAGRVATLTTEAVALASGGDRRVAASFGLMQAALPLVGFALALGLPALIWRNRAGMRVRHA
jgi:putative thiamine transport system permease protein